MAVTRAATKRIWIFSILGLAILVWLFILDVSTGDVNVAPANVFAALLHGPDPAGFFDPLGHLTVWEFRLPVTLAALLAGVGLALAGALMQTITRNPFASPDTLGVSQGAAAAAVLLLVGIPTWFDSSPLTDAAVPVAAFIGGLLSAVLVYVLAWRRGMEGVRLILVGIAISVVMQAITVYLLITGSVEAATRAQVWITGSVYDASWELLAIAFPLVILGAVACIFLTRHYRAIALGDDTAHSLGVPLAVVNTATVLIAVIVTAATVSVVGPLVFVGFAAPQIARLIAVRPAPPLVLSMVCGAVFVLAAAYLTRTIPQQQLPVGIATAVIGGPILVWLLFRLQPKGL